MPAEQPPFYSALQCAGQRQNCAALRLPDRLLLVRFCRLNISFMTETLKIVRRTASSSGSETDLKFRMRRIETI